MIFDLLAQAAQMALVLVLAPLVVGVMRKVKARLLRRIGPPTIACETMTVRTAGAVSRRGRGDHRGHRGGQESAGGRAHADHTATSARLQ